MALWPSGNDATYDYGTHAELEVVGSTPAGGKWGCYFCNFRFGSDTEFHGDTEFNEMSMSDSVSPGDTEFHELSLNIMVTSTEIQCLLALIFNVFTFHSDTLDDC